MNHYVQYVVVVVGSTVVPVLEYGVHDRGLDEVGPEGEHGSTLDRTCLIHTRPL